MSAWMKWLLRREMLRQHAAMRSRLGDFRCADPSAWWWHSSSNGDSE